MWQSATVIAPHILCAGASKVSIDANTGTGGTLRTSAAAA